jgi:hypothetical protein
LAIGCWLLAVGCWRLGVVCCLLSVVYWLLKSNSRASFDHTRVSPVQHNSLLLVVAIPEEAAAACSIELEIHSPPAVLFYPPTPKARF